MTPIIKYLLQKKLPPDKEEAKRVKRISVRYLMVADKLYKMGRSTPMLCCASEDDVSLVSKEVHEGICEIHIGGWALSSKILRARYFWPTMLKDCI